VMCLFPSRWEGLGEGAKLDAHKPSLCKPDIVYVLDRGHRLHF